MVMAAAVMIYKPLSLDLGLSRENVVIIVAILMQLTAMLLIGYTIGAILKMITRKK